MAKVELGISQGADHFKKGLHKYEKSILNSIGAHPLTQKLVRNMSSFLVETGRQMIVFNWDELDKVKPLIKPYSMLVFASNHLSHVDVLAVLEAVPEARKRFPTMGTVYFPVSATLENGRQGGIGQTFYNKVANPFLEKEGIQPLYVVTHGDKTKHRAEQNPEEAKTQARDLVKPVAEKASAYFVLPEGSVEGGRHNTDGTIKGMQRVWNPFLRLISEAAQKQGREIIYVPIGIDGTYQILSAENIFFTRTSFAEIIRKLLGMRLRKLAVVRAGTPFIIDPETNSRLLNKIVMGDHIAPLTSPAARGFYRKATPTDTSDSLC